MRSPELKCQGGPRFVGIVLVSKYMVKRHGPEEAIIRTISRRIQDKEERWRFIKRHTKKPPTVKQIEHSTNAVHHKTTAYYVKNTRNR